MIYTLQFVEEIKKKSVLKIERNETVSLFITQRKLMIVRRRIDLGEMNASIVRTIEEDLMRF